ncbi:MAG: chorismate-binding protein [Spirochaetales bacterium]|nr:chorismate-binding protein [Spirochaetales bacterium]
MDFFTVPRYDAGVKEKELSLPVFYDPDAAGWYVFSHEYTCIEVRPGELSSVVDGLREVTGLVQSMGLCAVGFISYQAAPAFDPAMGVPCQALLPLLSFRVFHTVRFVPCLSVEDRCLLFGRQEGDVVGAPVWEGVPASEYAGAFEEIKNCLARGRSYQVNYSCRFRSGDCALLNGRSYRLFALPQGYFGYYQTPSVEVVSFSPELFFRKAGSRITARPMKGTAPRDRDPVRDAALRGWLSASEKNRAENLMIVDMLRNDLGRLAVPGTVKVENLYGIETYPYVHQMVSTVRARTHAPVHEVMEALFPCASITGAPKVATMDIISRLETSPRDVYTGAFGVLLPGERAVFSVAIRTMWRGADDPGVFRYGAGGGIVWDSDVRGEWEEMYLKLGVVS